MLSDTIAAISTALGEAAISVLRCPGPQAFSIAAKVCHTRQPLQPRRAVLGDILDVDGHVIDRAMLLAFRGPASYTGEDIVELHCHGGVLVTQRVLERLLQAGARAAARRVHPTRVLERQDGPYPGRGGDGPDPCAEHAGHARGP